MSVMITGGSGFIGLNLAEQLLERGETAVLFSLTPPPELALKMLQRSGGTLHVVEGDVRDGKALDDAIMRHGVDRIVHGAAITAALEREMTAARTIAEVNLIGSIETFEAASRHRITKVVHLSTGSVYGPAGLAAERLEEDRHIPVPETLYGITKYAGERTALRYRQTRGLDLVVARLGSVFGRWEYDTGVRDTMSLALQLLEHAERNEPAFYPEHAGGDWVYGTDVAAGILLLLNGDGLSPSPLYHLSGGEHWLADEWARRLRDRFPSFQCRPAQSPCEINVGGRRPLPRAPFSIDRLRHEYGYKPRFDIDAAFEDLIDWRAAMRLA